METSIKYGGWWNSTNIAIIDHALEYPKMYMYNRGMERGQAKPFCLQLLDIDTIIYGMYIPYKFLENFSYTFRLIIVSIFWLDS